MVVEDFWALSSSNIKIITIIIMFSSSFAFEATTTHSKAKSIFQKNGTQGPICLSFL